MVLRGHSRNRRSRPSRLLGTVADPIMEDPTEKIKKLNSVSLRH